MAINQLQFPPLINVPQIDFSPLAGFSAAADRAAVPGLIQNAFAQQPQAPQAQPAPQAPQQQGVPLNQIGQPASAYAPAISGIESGGNYNAIGPTTNKGDMALGKYQVMASNVPQWTKDALGQSLTPQQFLENPQAQDAVFQKIFGGYVQKYGPEGAARAWFAGEGGMNDPNRKDQLGTTVAGYAQKFTNALGPQPTQQPSAAPQAAQPQQPLAGLRPDMAQKIGAMLANPYTAKLGEALLAKYAAPNYGFQVAGDTLYRTSATTGEAAPIQQISKPQFGVIGKDVNGNDVHGFANPQTKQVWDLQGNPVQPGQLSGLGQQPNSGLTGQPFLDTLDPGRAAQVKAIVEGRMAPPSGFALKSPQIQALMRDAAQYEPGFDMTMWTKRNSTVKDFASGKAAGNVTALNTVIGHLGDLVDKAEKLNNTRIPAINSVINYAQNAAGDPRIKEFDLARNAVADEMARVFRQSGMSDSEVRQWKENISSSNSPDQLKGVIKTALGLMESRLSALAEQRSNGFSTAIEPRALLNPKSIQTLEKVQAWANGEKPAEAKAPTTPVLGSVKIPIPAVKALQSDPSLREQFDAKYGAGASMRVLGK